jgi:hypothetical protein
MNVEQVAALRAMLAPTSWLQATTSFAASLRSSASRRSGLLLVGTADDEPWHLNAHLDDESRYAGLPELTPTLIRWAPPPGAPAHLAVGIDQLAARSRDRTLLVVSQQAAPAELLYRVQDARRAGATIFALDSGDADLDELAHEALPVRPGDAPVSFDAAQHLVSMAAGDPEYVRRGRRRAGSPTARLARFLDLISGTVPDETIRDDIVPDD